MGDHPMDVRGFVIHLDRAESRRPQVDRLLAHSPCPTEVMAAVDGRSSDPADLARAYPGTELIQPRYPFALGQGEIACFLSHRKVWSTIVERRMDAALILEDDVGLESTFPAVFGLACDHVARLGYIQFQTRPLPQGRIVAIAGEAALIRPLVLPLRTSAQLVSRGAAERLLELTAQFDRPIDAFLQMTWLSSLPFACARPSGVHDLTESLGGTTAQARAHRGLGQELVRTILRSTYRRRIARMARRIPEPA